MISAAGPLMRRNSLYSVAQLAGVEAERAGPALMGRAPVCINQVEPVRPCCIGLFRRIPKLIEHGRRLDSELANTCPGDESAIFFTLWAGENHAVPDVALHLPYVAGMRFRDVYHDELDPIAILVIKLVQGRNLPPEGRS